MNKKKANQLTVKVPEKKANQLSSINNNLEPNCIYKEVNKVRTQTIFTFYMLLT